MNLKDDPAHQAAHLAALRRRQELGLEPPDPQPDERNTKMFANNSVGSAELDSVLRILELIDGQTKGKVAHMREMALAFELLARKESEFEKRSADQAAKAAAKDKELATREKVLADRASALDAKADRLGALERDLERRLAILKSAAA